MQSEESPEAYSTVDEIEPPGNFCLANVGPDDHHYQSCGLKMRRRKNGVTVCPEHGEMH